jgi:hypothetical protein
VVLEHDLQIAQARRGSRRDLWGGHSANARFPRHARPSRSPAISSQVFVMNKRRFEHSSTQRDTDHRTALKFVANVIGTSAALWGETVGVLNDRYSAVVTTGVFSTSAPQVRRNCRLATFRAHARNWECVDRLRRHGDEIRRLTDAGLRGKDEDTETGRWGRFPVAAGQPASSQPAHEEMRRQSSTERLWHG